MRTPAHAPPASSRPPTKAAGLEPIPGYRLLEPLGVGGFGEVWKCEAPGGILKAVKFVADDPDRGGGQCLRQEFEAFQQIKLIRHPFLLALDRVEMVNGELVMVMELADQQLHDRQGKHLADGLPGIPRAELLGYLADAAEALDVISEEHGLQHLDVKPANIFVVGRRAKIGDFGLVGRTQADGPSGFTRGLTPKYAAPEVVRGQIDPRSDQYSLALVYFELLTGRFPFLAKSAQQLLLMHATAPPDLTALPAADRPTVGRALSKNPADRFPNCLDLVQTLIATEVEPGSVGMPPAGGSTLSVSVLQTRLHRVAPDTAPARTAAGLVGLTAAGRATGAVPALITARRQPAAPPPQAPVDDDADEVLDLVALAPAAARQPVRLERFHGVVPVGWLTGEADSRFDLPSTVGLVEAVVRSAAPHGVVPAAAGEPVRTADGGWAARFPTRIAAGVARLKLDVLGEAWGAEVGPLGPNELVVRRPLAAGGFWGRKKAGVEVTVRLPGADGRATGEAEAVGRVFGQPDPAAAREADRALPQMLDQVREQLMTVADRRGAVRVPADFPVTLYPVSGGGEVGDPVYGTCRDVSATGVCCLTTDPVEAAYVYVAFGGVRQAAGWAVLTRLTRVQPDRHGYAVAGKFRADA